MLLTLTVAIRTIWLKKYKITFSDFSKVKNIATKYECDNILFPNEDTTETLLIMAPINQQKSLAPTISYV